MSENKLKPCPFCGSTKLKIESKFDNMEKISEVMLNA